VILRLALLISLAPLGTFAFTLSKPILAFYVREDLRATVLGVSTLTIAYLGGRALGSSGVAYFARGRAAVLMPAIGFASMGLIFNLYPLASAWYQVSALRLVQGFMAGISWPVLQIMVTSAAPERLRGTVNTAYFLSGGLAISLANFAYAGRLSAWDMRSQMALSSSLFVLLAILSVIAGKDLPGAEWRSRPRSLKGARRDLLLASFLITFVVSPRGSELLYVYVREHIGMSKEATAALLGLADAISIVVQAVLGPASDFLGRGKMLLLSGVLSALSPAIAIGNKTAVMVGLVGMAAGPRVFMPVSRAIAAGSENPAATIGLMNSFGNLGVVAGQASLGAVSSLVGVGPMPLVLIPAIPPLLYVFRRFSD